MALPKFTLTGTLETLLGATSAPWTGASVELRCNFPRDSFLATADELLLLQPVELTTDDDGHFSVDLLADGESLNLDTAVQWYVKVAGLPGWWFNAPADGETIDLRETSAVTGVFPSYATGQQGQPGAQGEQGEPGAPGEPGADGTGAPTGLPAHAGAATNRYNPETSWYNLKPANTRRIRAGLARARAHGGPTHHVVLGDSVSSYYLGDEPHTQGQLKMWPYALRDHLVNAGVPNGGSGSVVLADVEMPAGIDPRVTLVGGDWGITASTFLQGNVSGDTLTFVSDQAGTELDLVYSDLSAPFTVAIDGGDPVTVTPEGAFTWEHYLVSGLSNAIHTVVVTLTSSSYFSGISLNQTSGLVVDKLGAHGSTAQGWVPSGPTDISTVRLSSLPQGTVPDALWLALGTNDILNAVSTADTAAALTTLAEQFPSSDVLLVVNFGVGGEGAALLDSWATAAYALADTLDVPLLDLLDRNGHQDVASANGLIGGGDNFHYSPVGQQDFGIAAAQPFS